jgi:RNA polymerase sigma factor (sigma-70 family)
MNDAMLVQEYAQSRSPAALAELASRHRDWVYSAALRMVGDVDMAQDVTQAVFLVLVQKAQALGRKPVNAWLFGVTRYAAKHALRDRARRKRHERMAVQMIGQVTGSRCNETWKEIAPVLDELVGRLNRNARQAVLLRFYEGKSMREVGAALGVSEDAAKKRVAKAVRRLRELLNARGVGVGDGALGSVMLLRTTHAAPQALATACAAPTAGATSISMGVIAMMAMARLKIAASVALAIALIPAAVVMALQSNYGSPATRPQATDLQTIADQSDDAVALYLKADAAIQVDSPASLATIYPEYSPGSPEWRRDAAAAWDADGRTRELAHQARNLWHADWRAGDILNNANHMRNLAANLADASVYAHSQSNDAQAVEIIRDLMHLSGLLKNSPSSGAIHMMVGNGLEAVTGNRVMIIATGVKFTNDPQNTRDLQVQTAHELIAQLLDHPNPQSLVDKAKKGMGPAFPLMPDTFPSRFLETSNRCDAEERLAAMSLASQLFKFEKGRWPNSLDELIPAYLPKAIVDPWGDGKQPFGYTLIEGGLPDGSDRPLVFSRCNSSDGLFYLVNKIHYGFTFDDGSDQPARLRKHGGEFRDVTHWQPIEHYTGPATRPLPPEALRTEFETTAPNSPPVKD